jgi:hypothetical protein
VDLTLPRALLDVGARRPRCAGSGAPAVDADGSESARRGATSANRRQLQPGALSDRCVYPTTSRCGSGPARRDP